MSPNQVIESSTSMFRGAFTALVTPFRDGQIDVQALTRFIERQIAAGIHGLVACGTTGEAPTLTTQEHLEVIEITVRATRGRVPVIAGAGSNCTREAVELTQESRTLGANAVLHVTPYYNNPTQDGLVAHMLEVADVGLPVLLYNVPGRTSVDLQAATVAKLARHPNIVGIKEATGNMERTRLIIESCGPDFDVLSGDDHTLLPLLAAGAHGVISVTSNVVPDLIAQLCTAMQEGRLHDAQELDRRLIRLTRALFTTTNPIPVKAALAAMDVIGPEVRLPLLPLASDSPNFVELRTQLVHLGLLT